jgi:hypothetical protein
MPDAGTMRRSWHRVRSVTRLIAVGGPLAYVGPPFLKSPHLAAEQTVRMS